jgi:parvulin-like peptidyl-prolyl isomerase
MQSNRLLWQPIALLAVSLSALPLVSVPANAQGAPATSAVAGAVAADVNGEKIYKADVERMISMIKEKEESLRVNSPDTQKALASLRESVVDNFIVQRLLVQEARKRNIVAPKEAVDKGVAAFKAEYGTDEAFQKALAAEGKTPADVQRTISEELMIRELITRLTSDITVTDADVNAFYNTRKEDFALPEMVRARHILVAYPDKATAEQKKQSRAKADGLLKQAQAKNADFGKLARENSDDPGTKDAGGDLDFATRGTFVKSFEDAVFGGQVGVVPRVIETEYGFHIIKVEQKEAARQMKFDEIKNDPQLRFTIRQGKIKKRIDEQISALRAKAKITKS